MKKIYLPTIQLFNFFGCLFFSAICFGQVGIGNQSPEGALDLNSANLPPGQYYGLVLPRVELTQSNLAAPVINPENILDPLPVGTVVYNTNTTYTGSYDVSPGIYMWNGVDWINEFPKKDAEIFKQDMTSEFRTLSTGGYVTIPGLLNQSFIPKYTGRYKIELSVNYGGGHAQNLAGGKTNPLSQKGNFKLTFNGVDYIFPISSHSTYGTTQYYLIWEQATTVMYQNLTKGTPYVFTLQFDQFDSPGFVGNGNSGDGRGYIGYDIPCSVEFVYVD
jgi:hypothetical protein